MSGLNRNLLTLTRMIPVEKPTIDALKQLERYKALFFREGDTAPRRVALAG